ncbi:MAG: AMP-binding protein, partial [Gammaproteobacteria bacterium]
MLTNWMGDSGFLKSLQITAVEPVLYGDTIWYRGKITDRIEDSSHFNLTIRILGENQLEQKTTEGFAEILIPLANKEVEKRTLRTEHPTVTANEACEFEDSFFNNVEEYPNKTAVKYGDETLSYTELDFQSNVLMRLLKKKNIGHENRVAVLVKRSIDSIVAPIAVLKVQAVYVPLDD